MKKTVYLFLISAVLFSLSSCEKVDINEGDTIPNRLEDVISDMKNPHEGNPHGVPEWWDWYANPTPKNQDKLKPPKGFEQVNFWGIAYEEKAGSLSKNTLVVITDAHLYCFSISKNKWIRIGNKVIPDYKQIDGGMYMEAYGQTDEEKERIAKGEPVSIPFDKAWEQKDKSLCGVMPGKGRLAHFWPANGRTSIYSPDGDPNGDSVVDYDDIGGFFATFKGKLALLDPNGVDDRDQANFIMAAGADYWEENSTASSSDGLGTGRLKYVTKKWKSFNFCSIREEQLRKMPLPPGVVK